MAQIRAMREAGYAGARLVTPKGAIVSIKASGEVWQGLYPEKMIMIDIPQISIDQVQHYTAAYRLEITYQQDSYDLNTDTYQVTMTGNANVSQTYGLTLAQVNAFLTLWNAQLVSNTVNSVTFTAAIYDVLTSNGFWGVRDDLFSQVVFTELDYNTGTKIHTIEADFSALTISPTNIEIAAHAKGATIVSHSNRVLVIGMESSLARTAFQGDVDRRTGNNLMKRRFYIDPVIVDEIIAQGGIRVTTPAVALTYVRDIMDD